MRTAVDTQRYVFSFAFSGFLLFDLENQTKNEIAMKKMWKKAKR